ncbi:MAG: sugar ABC transporter ATP-binding protein [Candidatus Eisenbacteria bacterium]|nr:sugar ABC transporter ATP-binding protein [Candidatus Eisenbacteria bacterium]
MSELSSQGRPTGKASPLLELRRIAKSFPGVRALDGVSFDLRPGEIHALCGENGAGKSTLIKVLCGYFPHGTFSGEIRLRGAEMRFRGLRAAEEQGIALIAQELALVPKLSVAENLLLGREPLRHGIIDRGALRASAVRALTRVGLEVDPDAPVEELGIGQQQMVEIARALEKRATILVLDEPTAALADRDAGRLFDLLRELRRGGVSSVYISHRLEEVLPLADRVTVLRDGRTVATAVGPSRDEVIRWMVGRDVRDLYPRAPRPGGDRAPVPLLSVRGLGLELERGPGVHRAPLCEVDFDLAGGEVLGVAGLMGAGRTALLSCLYGVARGHVQGTIALAGEPPRAPYRAPAEAMEAGVALVSEDRKRYGLVPEASVRDNLTLSLLRRYAQRGVLREEEREADCRRQVESLRLRTPHLAASVGRLSGGNQQKVLLGRALLRQPRVLLLDEPTRGIDVGAKAEIYQLIAELAAGGLGVVIVSSDLPELLGLSHRLLVLNGGRISARLESDATPESVLAAATARVA